MDICDFQKRKASGEKITFVTCYDYTSAQIAEASEIDAVLVGDTVAMTLHGHATTLPATVDLMVLHTQAVARGIRKKFVVADLPFLSYRKSLSETMQAVQRLMQSGAQAVKLEGAQQGTCQAIQHIVQSGVPVMGHIGLTPQSVHALGGFKVQGRNEKTAQALLQQAQLLEEAGCFAIVLECIPARFAKQITESLNIPTIGIGAGPHTSGQILVWQDLLGLQQNLNIKFVKSYLNGFNEIKTALNAYHREVCSSVYPNIDLHCYKEESN